MKISRMSTLSGVIRTLQIAVTDEQLSRYMDDPTTHQFDTLPVDEKQFILNHDHMPDEEPA